MYDIRGRWIRDNWMTHWYRKMTQARLWNSFMICLRAIDFVVREINSFKFLKIIVIQRFTGITNHNFIIFTYRASNKDSIITSVCLRVHFDSHFPLCQTFNLLMSVAQLFLDYCFFFVQKIFSLAFFWVFSLPT